MTTSALILLLYDRVLPGGQLVNRLEDEGYRVKVIADPAELLSASRAEKPLLVMADLEREGVAVRDAIVSLKRGEDTSHIPVIAFGVSAVAGEAEGVRSAGATLAVTDAAILAHLDQLMEQALHVE